jgi:hypothetical protein
MPDKPNQQHDHRKIEIRTECPDCGQELARQTLNRADLEQQQMTELPNREAMSLVNANLAIPINLALAATSDSGATVVPTTQAVRATATAVRAATTPTTVRPTATPIR